MSKIHLNLLNIQCGGSVDRVLMSLTYCVDGSAVVWWRSAVLWWFRIGCSHPSAGAEAGVPHAVGDPLVVSVHPGIHPGIAFSAAANPPGDDPCRRVKHRVIVH